MVTSCCHQVWDVRTPQPGLYPWSAHRGHQWMWKSEKHKAWDLQTSNPCPQIAVELLPWFLPPHLGFPSLESFREGFVPSAGTRTRLRIKASNELSTLRAIRPQISSIPSSVLHSPTPLSFCALQEKDNTQFYSSSAFFQINSALGSPFAPCLVPQLLKWHGEVAGSPLPAEADGH